MNLGSAVLTVSLTDADVERIARALREGSSEAEAPSREPWLDVEGAAAYLACKKKRIYDAVSQGRLRPGRDGRRLVFRREWLDALIDLDGGEYDTPEGLENDATGQ